MYLINHFLDKVGILGIFSFLTPDVDAANQTNAVSGEGSLGVQVSTCAATYGRNPNFMLVDVSYSCGNIVGVLTFQFPVLRVR